MLSQIAVCGIHLSVLKHISQYSSDKEKTSDIITSGILLTAGVAAAVSVIAFFTKDWWALALNSADVGVGVGFIAPGLFFFALNKVLINYHNGHRRMKAVAVFQALRFILLFLCLWAFISISLEGSKLAAVFSVSEFILFLGLLAYSLLFVKMTITKKTVPWVKAHFVFGFKAAPGNILDQTNSRVGVIVLGIFASDAVVGVFSFAQMMAEGFAQLGIVIMMNINPILTQTKFEKGNDALRHLIHRTRNMCYVVMVPLGILAVLVFPPLMNIFHLEAEFAPAWGLFAIMMALYLAAVGYMPFMMLLSQTGFPGSQSILIFPIFAINIILNLTLVPFIQMYGAAVATGLSFIAAMILLKILTRKALGIGI